jgi:hypothetical protein
LDLQVPLFSVRLFALIRQGTEEIELLRVFLPKVLHQVALLGVFALAQVALVWALGRVSGHVIPNVAQLREDSTACLFIAFEHRVDLVGCFIHEAESFEVLVLLLLDHGPAPDQLSDLLFLLFHFAGSGTMRS